MTTAPLRADPSPTAAREWNDDDDSKEPIRVAIARSRELATAERPASKPTPPVFREIVTQGAWSADIVRYRAIDVLRATLDLALGIVSIALMYRWAPFSLFLLSCLGVGIVQLVRVVWFARALLAGPGRVRVAFDRDVLDVGPPGAHARRWQTIATTDIASVSMERDPARSLARVVVPKTIGWRLLAGQNEKGENDKPLALVARIFGQRETLTERWIVRVHLRGGGSKVLPVAFGNMEHAEHAAARLDATLHAVTPETGYRS